MSDEPQDDELDDEPQDDGPVWERAGKLVDVSFPARTIELIVIPYETSARVEYQDRIVDETIARGAFDGISRRPNRIRVNREHRREDTVGRAVALHPSRQEGLVAEVKIANTDRGTEALELCADGCLDASAAFRPMTGGIRWDGPNAYTVTKAWLAHIALTSEPAYPGARVIAVRHAVGTRPHAVDIGPHSTTPNLDAWKRQRDDERTAALAASLNLA